MTSLDLDCAQFDWIWSWPELLVFYKKPNSSFRERELGARSGQVLQRDKSKVCLKPAHSFELKAEDYFELIFCRQDSVKRNNDFRGVCAGGDGAASGKGQVSHRGQKKIQ